MNVALLVGCFPTLTETWVIDEIAALLRRGDRVTVYADAADPAEAVHPTVREMGMMRLVRLRPRPPRSKPGRVAQALGLAAGALPRHPVAAIGGLNAVRYGRQAASGDLIRAVVSHLGRERYDVVHCHDAWGGLTAAACKGWGLIRDPLVTTFHGPDLTMPSHVRRMRGYRPLIRWGDAFTVGSEYIRGHAIRVGFPADRVAVTPLGIDLSQFPWSERATPADGRARLLSVARLHPVKGLEYGIRAFARIAGRFPGATYTIAGDGPLRDHLRGVVREVGMEGRVEFPGMLPRDRLRPLWDASHLFVMPGIEMEDGHAEGQGMVLLEAQASGLPVIVSRAGGMPENVEPGASALLVEPRDVEGLAGAMAELLSRPERWAAMGRAGRGFVERHRRIESMHRHLFELLERVARTGRRE